MPHKNHNPWLFSCSVIERNMHILRSAAEPQLEGNSGGSPPNSKIKDLWNGRALVLVYHGAVKATQGHSGTQLKREGRGELHYLFQWINSEQNWSVYVLSFFPSIGTICCSVFLTVVEHDGAVKEFRGWRQCITLVNMHRLPTFQLSVERGVSGLGAWLWRHPVVKPGSSGSGEETTTPAFSI